MPIIMYSPHTCYIQSTIEAHPARSLPRARHSIIAHGGKKHVIEAYPACSLPRARRSHLAHRENNVHTPTYRRADSTTWSSNQSLYSVVPHSIIIWSRWKMVHMPGRVAVVPKGYGPAIIYRADTDQQDLVSHSNERAPTRSSSCSKKM